MPDGNAHRALTLVTGAVVFGVESYLGAPAEVILFTCAGCLLGLVVHPDLDQAESHKGPWASLWYCYGKVVPHRSISHWPVVGTLSRLAYLGLLALIVLAIFAAIRWETSIAVNPVALWAIPGLAAADLAHIAADRIDTTFKRMRRRR